MKAKWGEEIVKSESRSYRATFNTGWTFVVLVDQALFRIAADRDYRPTTPYSRKATLCTLVISNRLRQRMFLHINTSSRRSI